MSGALSGGRAKHDEFLKKNVKVLPTQLLREIRSADGGLGKILQDVSRAQPGRGGRRL